MLESEDRWEDAEPEESVGSCTADAFDVVVAFSLLAGHEVRWVSVGVRCIVYGVLGCCADREIDYTPSRQLFDVV